MSDKPATMNVPVHPLNFRRAVASEDGETVIFETADPTGKLVHLEIGWQNLSVMAHMLNQAGVEAAQKRGARGQPDDFTGVGTAQLVAGFQISDVPERHLKIMSLRSPSGLRCDFALPTDTRNKQGDTLPHVLARELARELSK